MTHWDGRPAMTEDPGTMAWAFDRLRLAFAALFWELVYALKVDILAARIAALLPEKEE